MLTLLFSYCFVPTARHGQHGVPARPEQKSFIIYGYVSQLLKDTIKNSKMYFYVPYMYVPLKTIS